MGEVSEEGVVRVRKVQGYYWHINCVYDDGPGYIRMDDGGEPERGDFIDRAISMGEARRLDRGESASCHPCLKARTDSGKRPSAGERDDFVVFTYELSADICDCGTLDRGLHEGKRELIEQIWANAPELEGAKMADKLVCGDCWYKESNMPPDERRSMEVAVECSNCGDPSLEVVVIKGKDAPARSGGMVVDTDEIDGVPEDYVVKVTWQRQREVTYYYEMTVGNLDYDDLASFKDGNEWDDSAWDVAAENSDSDNETGVTDDEGLIDDGPTAINWEVLQV